MKLLAYILIPLLSVSSAAVAFPQIDVQIFETGENTISANWNGQALTTTFLGNQTWDIHLDSAGHTVVGEPGEQINWFEPDNGLFNVVTVTSSTDLLFQSEVPFAPLGAGPFPSGTSFFIGTDFAAGQDAFAQVFDPASVPDGGSTLGLIGLGLAGLALLKSKFKSARK